MEVILASLTVPGLDAAVRQGASHPVLGPYLLGGSHCAVEGVADAGEVLDAGKAAGLTVLGDPSPADLAAAGERGALCLVVTDGDGAGKPVVILYGRGLPALGAIPSCMVRDLQHTWAALAGSTAPAGTGGRHLLHEQPQDWDPQLERELTQRLRQLYGE
jgi:hypothetical protein